MHKIVYTVKLVISRIQNKTSHGFLQKVEAVQITQICKFFVTTLILALTISPLFAKDKAFNDYGNYLEWIYAKEIKDLKKLKKTFKNISLSNVKENTLEELLFESIIFDDWDAGKEISIKLIEINKDNATANLFLLVDDFLEKKKINFIY